MRKKICFISSSRADFGIMRNLIKAAHNKKNFFCSLIITGSHLSKNFGYTSNEIKEYYSGKIYKIKTKDKIYNNKDLLDVSSNILKKVSLLLKKNKFDLCILLGDRYEILQLSYAFFINKIPVLHISGGDVTVGSQDNVFRNMISLMSSYHFVTNKYSKGELKKIGIEKSKIFNLGHLSLDNLKNLKFLSKKKLSTKYKLDFKKKNFFVSIHPETSKKKDYSLNYIKNLIKIAKRMKEVSFIFSSSNFDVGGMMINDLLANCSRKISNINYVASFGQKDLFSLYKQVDGFIGNSSSGIIEFPSFKKTTINIGNRQKGRFYSPSIIQSNGSFGDLEKKIKKVIKTKIYRNNFHNIYQKKNTLNNYLQKLKLILNY